MPYTANQRAATPSSAELRARIPGWGADLGTVNRRSEQNDRCDPGLTGARWDYPAQQPETWPRERSIEHAHLTPVFGTSTPPRGLSGVMRRYAYRRFSEARAAHFLILLAADRVDAIESHLLSFLTLRPDNPVTETGVLSEFTHKPVSSRIGQNRSDVRHMWMDPVIVGAPWAVAVGVMGFAALKAVRLWRRVTPRCGRDAAVPLGPTRR